ncbi:MAG TPA: discoidin domain-containing protein [Polyangiaceae bacterium]
MPSFGYQSAAEQTLNACHDGQLSPGEADVDCGRLCSAPCASGSTCTDDLDCASVFCSAGTCTDQTCSDKLKNQDESDIDCGGATGCDRCVPGKSCMATSDCNGGACMAGVCHAPSCTDGVKNQTESDIDCGGTCGPCSTGEVCHSADDCDLALCTGGKCRAQSCSDGLLNQDESDIDCGGSTGCARCATTQHCLVNADCDHAACSKGSCQASSCSDGVVNGDETDIDCGGSCKACAPLAACLLPKDCDSSVCTLATHKCAPPTCTDGVLNGAEPTVDCGASCTTKCKVADNCVMPADCATRVCTNLHCVPAAPSSMPLSTVGWLATASESEDNVNVPNNVLDGNLNTFWTTGAEAVAGIWFEVDMVTPRVFFTVAVTETSVCCDYGKTFRLSGSLDGNTFTELRTNIVGENLLKITFTDPQYWRYVKIETLDSTGFNWWRIDELAVLQ